MARGPDGAAVGGGGRGRARRAAIVASAGAAALVAGLVWLGRGVRAPTAAPSANPADRSPGAAVTGTPAAPVATAPPEDPRRARARVQFEEIAAAWETHLRAQKKEVVPPRLLLASEPDAARCAGEPVAGARYCAAERTIVLDLALLDALDEPAGGAAFAYLAGHLAGHHAQELLGTAARVADLRRRAPFAEQAAAFALRLELQADCYAGATAAERIGAGEFDAALRAAESAAARRARAGGGDAAGERFAHGSPEQRLRWLRHGVEHRRPEACNLFTHRPL